MKLDRPADLIILPASRINNHQDHWYNWLADEMTYKGLRVLKPDFPGGNAQTLENWIRVLQDHKHLLADWTIAVGHSLGGRLLLSWLEYHTLGAAILVAAPYREEPKLWEQVSNRPEASTGFWSPHLDWNAIQAHAKFFGLFYGNDDKLISREQAHTLRRQLGGKITWIRGGGHLDENSHFAQFHLLAARIEFLHNELTFPAIEGAPSVHEKIP